MTRGVAETQVGLSARVDLVKLTRNMHIIWMTFLLLFLVVVVVFYLTTDVLLVVIFVMGCC